MRLFFADTGRSCGDFFRSLRTGSSVDSYLAGRATLLSALHGAGQRVFFSFVDTFCRREPAPEVGEAERGPRAPPPPPPRAEPLFRLDYQTDGFSSQATNFYFTLGEALAQWQRFGRPGRGGFYRISDRNTGVVYATGS